MNPPIRDKKHQDMLWKAVKDGIADTIGSDHAPHSLEIKRKNILKRHQECQEFKL